MALTKLTVATMTPSVTFLVASAPTMMATKNITYSRDFRPNGFERKGKEEEKKGRRGENMEELVRK